MNECERVTKIEVSGANAASNDEMKGEWLLSKSIEKTRACHIEAERRLLGRAKLVSHANLYYGCWSAILTLLTLVPQYNYLGLPAACFASAVALWAAYASAEKYELRARDFFDSYLALQQLWGECEDWERMDNSEERHRHIADLRTAYRDVLSSTENHTEADYVTYRYKDYRKRVKGGEKIKIPCELKRSYCWHWVKTFVLLPALVYVVVPFVLLFSPHILACIHKLF